MMCIPRHAERLLTILLAAAAFLAFAPTARAQFDTATVLGAVRDANEAAAPGATVTLTNVGTGVGRTITSDESGDYQFTSVPIGVYKVTAALRGFSTTVVEDVRVAVNARQRVDLSLPHGHATQDGRRVRVGGEEGLQGEFRQGDIDRRPEDGRRAEEGEEAGVCVEL